MKALLIILFFVSLVSVRAQLVVEQTALGDTVLDAGETMVPILSFSLEAVGDDMDFQRLRINVGDTPRFYTKIFKTVYLLNDLGGTMVQANLNSDTMVKNGSYYELTLGGFGSGILEGTSRNFTLLADLYSAIDPVDQHEWAVSVDAGSGGFSSGIRATNGTTGLDEFGPLVGFSQIVTVQDLSSIPEPSAYSFIIGIGSLSIAVPARRSRIKK